MQDSDKSLVVGLLKAHFKQILLIALITSAGAFSSSCGKITAELNFSHTPPVQDFKKSQIISNGPQVADGSSSLLVVISLLNSDGTPVIGFTPVYQILSGGGVTSLPCTSSNANGVSTCILKSTQAGTKLLSVTNITISLQASLVFTSPSAGQSHIELASSSKSQTQGSYTLTAAVGPVETGIKKVSGTYSLFGSIHGAEFSK